jgi:hypothetical protein
MDALYKYFLLTFAVHYGLELMQLSCLFQELALSELDVQGPGTGWDHGLLLNDLGIYPAF